MQRLRILLAVALVAGLPCTALAQALINSEFLLAADGKPGDGFGRRVALSGRTLIVGANGVDDRGEDSGAAYVFVKDTAGAWTQQAKLLPAELQAGDFFGWSVDVDGDLAVVGAPGDKRGAANPAPGLAGGRGAAYVFIRVNGTWQQWQRLQPDDLVAGDRFGWRVAASQVHLLVSAPWHTTLTQWGGVEPRTLFTYSRQATHWSPNGPVTVGQAPGMGPASGTALDLDGALAVTGTLDSGAQGVRLYANPAGTWIPFNVWPSFPPRDGVGHEARFASLECLTSDGEAALVCDRLPYSPGAVSVRRITTGAAVTTIAALPPETRAIAAGAGSSLWLASSDTVSQRFADGKVVRVARLQFVAAIAAGNAPGAYVNDGCAIRRVSEDGTITPVAGASNDCTWFDAVGTAARFAQPQALALSHDGARLYVADGPVLRAITLSTGLVETLAGAPSLGGTPVDGIGPAARFRSISSLAVDADGTVWIADNFLLRKMTPDRQVSTLVSETSVTAVTVAGNLVIVVVPGVSRLFVYTPPSSLGPFAGPSFSQIQPADAFSGYDVAIRGNMAVSGLPQATFFDSLPRGGGAHVYEWADGQLSERIPTEIIAADTAMRYNRIGTAVAITEAGHVVLGPANGCMLLGPGLCFDDTFTQPEADFVFPIRLYRKSGYNWLERTWLPTAGAVPRSGYGSTLATDGDLLVAGAPEWDYRPQENPPYGEIVGPGRVFVYDLASLDSDRDTIPDTWEERFALNPTEPTDAALDADADGASNVQEYRQQSHPRNDPAHTRYFAEGATSAFFETEIAIANPGDEAATVLLRFLPATRVPASTSLVVPARASRRVRVSDVPAMAYAEFSTVIESDHAVVVDRLMSWSRADGYGSHGERAVVAPQTTWYLAEGATHSGFDLFYLLQNATNTDARVRVTYLQPAAPPREKDYVVQAGSRRTIWVNTEMFSGDPATRPGLSSAEVSAVIASLDAVPITVERAMYKTRPPSNDPAWKSFEAGHASAGVAAPATRWFFAEGAAGTFFDTFLLLANPSAIEATVRLTYLLPDGRTFTRDLQAAPLSRTTVWVDYETFPGVTGFPLVDAGEISTTVEVLGEVPIIAERAMWWPGPTSATWTEAHGSPGAISTATRWAVAGGDVQDAARRTDTYYLVANPTDTPAQVRVTLLFTDASAPATRTFAVAPHSRFNVDVRAQFTGVTGRSFGAVVESLGDTPAPIVVEWAIYSDALGVTWAAGANALATPWP